MQKSVFGVFVDIFGTYSYIFVNDDYLIWPILYDKKHVLLRQFVKLLIILKRPSPPHIKATTLKLPKLGAFQRTYGS